MTFKIGLVKRINTIEEKSRLMNRINANRNLVPDCSFRLIDYSHLLYNISIRSCDYNIIVAYEVMDKLHSTHNNICVTLYEARKNGLDTIFIVSFDEILSRYRKRDIEIEKLYVEKLEESKIPGIIFTTSTEESFLLNIIRDVLGDPKAYKNKHLRIESQRDFLVYRPGETQMSYSSG